MWKIKYRELTGWGYREKMSEFQFFIWKYLDNAQTSKSIPAKKSARWKKELIRLLTGGFMRSIYYQFKVFRPSAHFLFHKIAIKNRNFISIYLNFKLSQKCWNLESGFGTKTLKIENKKTNQVFVHQ